MAAAFFRQALLQQAAESRRATILPEGDWHVRRLRVSASGMLRKDGPSARLYDAQEIAGGAARKSGPGGSPQGRVRFLRSLSDRIIFPIHDENSRVVGFGGRVLDDSAPKYLILPRRRLHQAPVLYGLNWPKIFAARRVRCSSWRDIWISSHCTSRASPTPSPHSVPH